MFPSRIKIFEHAHDPGERTLGQPRRGLRVPDAAQRAAMRRRSGTAKTLSLEAIPAQWCITPQELRAAQQPGYEAR
jgi:hypothetical protein